MSTKKYGHIQSYAEQRKQAKLREAEEEEYDGRYGSYNGTKVKLDIFGKEYGRIGTATVLKTNTGTGYKKVLGDIPEDIPLGASVKELKEWEKTDPTRFQTANGVQPKIISKGGIGKMGTGMNFRIPTGTGGGIAAKINAGLTAALNTPAKGINAFKGKGAVGGIGAKVKGVGALNAGINTGYYQEEETSGNKYLEIDNNGNFVAKKPKVATTFRINNEEFDNRSLEEIWALKLLEEVSDDEFDRKITENQRRKFYELSGYVANRNTNGIREVFEWFAEEFKDYKRALPQNATIVFAVIGKYSEAVTISLDTQNSIPAEVLTKIQALESIVGTLYNNSSIATMLPDSAARVLDNIFDNYKNSSLEEIGRYVSYAENVLTKLNMVQLAGPLDLIRGLRESVEGNLRGNGRNANRVGGMRVQTTGASDGNKWTRFTGGARRPLSTRVNTVGIDNYGLDGAGVGLMGKVKELGVGTGGTKSFRYDDRAFDNRLGRVEVPKSGLNTRGRVGSEFSVANRGTINSANDDPFGTPVYSLNTGKF
jgi:hypothetical protein